MNHSYLTIVAIYGHHDGSSAIPAILESMSQMPGSRGLLISISEPNGLPKSIKWQQIFPMNYRQYSLFVMFSLHHFIETDFCLTVQDDGWVLNGDNWDDRFLTYDYIGAPCHAAIVDSQLLTGYRWVKAPNPRVIQNGGFSLRSQRYLRAPTTLGALYHFSDNETLWNEDVQLTGIWREHLEKHGIRFATNSTAKQFSIEFLGPEFHDNLDFGSLFGFHGKIRKLVDHKTIRYSIFKAEAMKIYREPDVIQFLEGLGYSLEFRD